MMKKMIKADYLAFLLILALFSIITIVDSLSFPGYAGLLPLCTGFAMLVFSAILVSMRFSSRLSEVFGAYFGLKTQVSERADTMKQGQEEALPWARVFICLGWILAFFALITLLGFFISIPLFTFAQLRLFCRRRWLSSLAATLIIWGFVYLISTLLDMRLFPGVIFGGILPSL